MPEEDAVAGAHLDSAHPPVHGPFAGALNHPRVRLVFGEDLVQAPVVVAALREIELRTRLLEELVDFGVRVSDEVVSTRRCLRGVEERIRIWIGIERP